MVSNLSRESEMVSNLSREQKWWVIYPVKSEICDKWWVIYPAKSENWKMMSIFSRGERKLRNGGYLSRNRNWIIRHDESWVPLIWLFFVIGLVSMVTRVRWYYNVGCYRYYIGCYGYRCVEVPGVVAPPGCREGARGHRTTARCPLDVVRIMRTTARCPLDVVRIIKLPLDVHWMWYV